LTVDCRLSIRRIARGVRRLDMQLSRIAVTVGEWLAKWSLERFIECVIFIIIHRALE
jgi:hypothetical protein